MSLFQRYFGCRPSGYILRNDQGVMVALLNDEILAEIFRCGHGEWTQKNIVGKGKITVYAFNKDPEACYTLNLAGVRLYIWGGYWLEKNTTIGD